MYIVIAIFNCFHEAVGFSCVKPIVNLWNQNLIAPTFLHLFDVLLSSTQRKQNKFENKKLYLDQSEILTDKMCSGVGLEAFYCDSRVYYRSTILNSKKSTPKLYFLLSLLLLSGNVELNPGPTFKFPCGLCTKPVKINQKVPIWHVQHLVSYSLPMDVPRSIWWVCKLFCCLHGYAQTVVCRTFLPH